MFIVDLTCLKAEREPQEKVFEREKFIVFDVKTNNVIKRVAYFMSC
jgi:hypothetical protein